MKARWKFSIPQSKNILVYDAEGNHIAKLFFKKSDYHLFHIRYEEFNIRVILNTVIKFGLNNLKRNYKIEYISQVKPKLIINFLDNNLTFYTLKKFYKFANFTCVQTSSRDDQFFNQCKEYYKKNNTKLEIDNFFVVSENDKQRFSKIINSNYQVIGTLKNNLYSKIKNYKKQKKKILFISQQNYELSSKDFFKKQKKEKEKKIFDELYKVVCEKKWNLTLSSKNTKKAEKEYRKQFTNGNWKYLSGDKVANSYNAVNTHDLIVFTNSSLGLEALTKYKKCISFPPDYFPFKGFNLKYPKEGPFWSCKFTKKRLRDLIDKIDKYNQIKWNKLVNKYIKNIMYYDPNNKKFKEFLKKNKFKKN